MRRLLPFILIGIGIIIILTGFAYDIFFAGIPYQDPTPELAARYGFHSQIAAAIRWLGLSICCLGSGGIVIGGVIRIVRMLGSGSDRSG